MPVFLINTWYSIHVATTDNSPAPKNDFVWYKRMLRTFFYFARKPNSALEMVNLFYFRGLK